MLFTVLILGFSSIITTYFGYKIKFQKRVDLINLYKKSNKIKDIDALCDFIGNRLFILSILVLAMCFFLESNTLINAITISILIVVFNTTYGLYFSGKYLD